MANHENLSFTERLAELINGTKLVLESARDRLGIDDTVTVTAEDVGRLTVNDLAELVVDDTAGMYRLDVGITRVRAVKPASQHVHRLSRGKYFTFEPSRTGRRYVGMEHFRTVGAAVRFIGMNSATKAFNCIHKDSSLSESSRHGITPLPTDRIRKLHELPDHVFRDSELPSDNRVLPVWSMFDVETFLSHTASYFDKTDWPKNGTLLALYYTMRLTQQVLDGDKIDWADLPDYR